MWGRVEVVEKGVSRSYVNVGAVKELERAVLISYNTQPRN